jgi:hypothetical protein
MQWSGRRRPGKDAFRGGASGGRILTLPPHGTGWRRPRRRSKAFRRAMRTSPPRSHFQTGAVLRCVRIRTLPSDSTHGKVDDARRLGSEEIPVSSYQSPSFTDARVGPFRFFISPDRRVGAANCKIFRRDPIASTPEAFQQIARGREAIPRETAEWITNPERVAESGTLRTAFGVRFLHAT